jgi:hypothetical protein
VGSIKFPSKKRGAGVCASPIERGARGVFIMKRILYNPKLKEIARRLRNNSTKAEIKSG